MSFYAQGIHIQWQRLPSPPAPIVNLEAPWQGVRIRGDDSIIYSKWVWGTRSEDPWFINENPISEEADQYSKHCTLGDLPFSFSFNRPASLQACRQFEVHIEARNSYVVLDNEQQLWVWVNSYSGMVEGLWYAGIILLASLILSPIVSVLLIKRFHR